MRSDPAEKAEILPESQKVVVSNGMDAARSEVPAVADGGAKAYVVALASFLVNGLLFGIINSYSVIYTVLLNRLQLKGIEGAEVKASLAGSLTIGTTFALSPVSGILTEFLGLRKTAVLGGIIATASMLISSFIVDHIGAFCFTYGILFGLGASFTYTPSLAILGQYFKRKLGIVNGVVTVGTLTIILPFINIFGIVVAISLCMGLFDGGFIALIGPIAFELVGTGHAAQAIGCMLGLAAVPLSIGPSIAGAIHRVHNSYTLPFVLAGISPIAGATVMFLVHWSKRTQPPHTNGHAISLNERDIEKSPAPLLTPNGQANQQATH
ncbi:major facilitator superfamily domain-containing protein [Phthorimaea operculella]|nr:major facilitator superfamily domain-containing protein [Phthorimaea operculella]